MVNNDNIKTDSKINNYFQINYPKLYRNIQGVFGVGALVKNKFSRVTNKLPSRNIYKGLDVNKFYAGKLEQPEEGSMRLPGEDFKQAPDFDILKSLKTNIDEVSLFFRFMLDPNLIKTKVGIDISNGQNAQAVKRVNPNLQRLMDQAYINLNDYLGNNFSPVLRSFINMIRPLDYEKSFKEIYNKYINQTLLPALKDLDSSFAEKLENTFRTDDINSVRAKTVSTLCTDNLQDDLNRIRKFSEELKSNQLLYQQFNKQDLFEYLKALEKSAPKFDEITNKLVILVNRVVEGTSGLFNYLKDVIEQTLQDLFEEMQVNQHNMIFIPIYKAVFPNANINNINPNELKYIKSLINSNFDYMYSFVPTFYIISLIGALCQYVEYIDVEIDTVKADALDIPNYTLVLPIETIAMLHASIVAKQWRDLVEKGQTVSTNLTDNYVKGMINFVHKRLEIPNLIVVDTSKKQVFYKLQYMSDINKSNIQTFETYVNNLMNKELDQSNYY